MTNFASRNYAHPLDRHLYDSDMHGVSRSPEAIGGYYGMGWYEYFQDRDTAEVYRVHCSDGVNGGKSAHCDEDEAWIDKSYRHIKRATQDLAASGVTEIRLSRNEWVVMLKRTHASWLDPLPGEKYAKQVPFIQAGVIGYIHGVSVVVDPSKGDEYLKPSIREFVRGLSKV